LWESKFNNLGFVKYLEHEVISHATRSIGGMYYVYKVLIVYWKDYSLESHAFPPFWTVVKTEKYLHWNSQNSLTFLLLQRTRSL